MDLFQGNGWLRGYFVDVTKANSPVSSSGLHGNAEMGWLRFMMWRWFDGMLLV
ncbi:hypothetical protein [Chromobacterium amazonense]|uniref:hypothetical protein n=1 Tax=Chromobacterium amazonense TaxID=1382803 RepID=UPI00166F721D|nr:hypothetical protein [Chromobacterium amazonense]